MLINIPGLINILEMHFVVESSLSTTQLVHCDGGSLSVCLSLTLQARYISPLTFDLINNSSCSTSSRLVCKHAASV